MPKKKGQSLHSKDLSSAFIFVIAVAALISSGPAMSLQLQSFTKMAFEMAVSRPFDGTSLDILKAESFRTFAVVLSPLLGSLFIGALAISFLQSGAMFTLQPLMPKFNKLNPLEGMKRIFSVKGIVQLLKASVIMTVLFYIAYQLVLASLRDILLTQGTSILNTYAFSTDLIKTLFLRSAVLMAVVGGADYMYQRWQFNKDMMMSKEDVKNEYKEQEGDPHYKSKRKRMHQELTQGNMLKNARKADVVIVNPTRYAVAIKYDRKGGGAPMVLAKGERVMADKIRQIAKEEGIPVMRNVGLAQALMKVEVDDYIPEDLFEAVAEVLNWVYKMKKSAK